MKRNKSILSKLFGKNEIVLDPGDIFFLLDTKTYWIYLGKDEDVTPNGPGDELHASKDGIVHYKNGLWSSDYIAKMPYDPEQMYKVNNDIVFHFKFEDNRSFEDILKHFKNDKITYIMTLNSEELSALNAAYTLYNIKSNKRS